jgi:hypothetical protein
LCSYQFPYGFPKFPKTFPIAAPQCSRKTGDAPIMWPFKKIQNCGGVDD